VLAGAARGVTDAEDVEVDARWIEMDYGDLDGRPDGTGRAVVADVAAGSGLRACRRRVSRGGLYPGARGLRRAGRYAARGDVVVVSHVPVLLAFSDAGPVDRSDRADR
jgi:hypothetical protein